MEYVIGRRKTRWYVFGINQKREGGPFTSEKLARAFCKEWKYPIKQKSKFKKQKTLKQNISNSQSLKKKLETVFKPIYPNAKAMCEKRGVSDIEGTPFKIECINRKELSGMAARISQSTTRKIPIVVGTHDSGQSLGIVTMLVEDFVVLCAIKGVVSIEKAAELTSQIHTKILEGRAS